MVDLLSNLGRVVQFDNLTGDLGAHIGKDIKITIAESVVKQHAISLRNGGWATHNVDNGNAFRIGAGHAIDGRKLTNTESGDERGEFANSSISIGSVRYQVLMLVSTLSTISWSLVQGKIHAHGGRKWGFGFEWMRIWMWMHTTRPNEVMMR